MSSILLFNFIDNFLSILFFKHQVIFNSLELIIFFFINIFLFNFFSRLLKIFSKLVFSPEPILKILNDFINGVKDLSFMSGNWFLFEEQKIYITRNPFLFILISR